MPDQRHRDQRDLKLRLAILDYIGEHPDCCAHEIVASLAIERGIARRGLTVRKVAQIIRGRLGDQIKNAVDRRTGNRLYRLA